MRPENFSRRADFFFENIDKDVVIWYYIIKQQTKPRRMEKMIKTDYGLRVAKKLVNLDKMALVTTIVDELKEYETKMEVYGWPEAARRTTNKSRFLMGLVYSEFMTDETTSEAYALAEEKRQVFLKALGIDGQWLRKEVERLAYGRC